jgi:hypothetical protein
MAILIEVEPIQGVTDIVPDYQGNFAALGLLGSKESR